MPRRSPRSLRAALSPLAALCLLALALRGAPARADEIEVDGKPMSGKVVEVTAKGLEVETTFGKGNVLVPYDRITALRTDEPFAVLHGDDGEAIGRLVGVREGALLVGNDPASAEALPIASLHESVSEKKFQDSALLRMRSALRYWKAHYDLAFAATDSTSNSLAFATGFEVQRKKSPTLFLAGASYRLATSDDPSGLDSREETTQNEVLGSLRGEYDLTPRFYTFAAGAAEYDEVESLSLRATPKGGVGVHIINTEKNTLNADIGGAWVYERFFGGSENRYFAIAFGTNGSFTLPYGSTLTIRGEYLPAVDDWAKDYLLTGSAALLFPMTDWLSFKTSVIDQYDNTPAEDNSQNSLTATAGLALVF